MGADKSWPLKPLISHFCNLKIKLGTESDYIKVFQPDIGDDVMLEDLTSEELVSLNIEARTWEDAVRKSAEPLKKAGKIKQSYIERMIENIKTAGPYIVISPHVALPHAHPDSDVMENAIGIATLKTPIRFGNEANDPVKYVFCICATKQERHLSALADLAKLLDEPSFYRILDEATSPGEILHFIKKF